MQSNTTPSYPGTVAPKSRRWVRPVAFSAAGVLTLFIGVGIGVSGSDAPADATPAPTKTVTAEPIVETETVTETVEVPVTPDACITALDHADGLLDASMTVIDVAAGAFGLIPRAAEAGMDYDVAAMEQIAVEGEEMGVLIEEQTAIVGPLRADYDTAVLACRGTGA